MVVLGGVATLADGVELPRQLLLLALIVSNSWDVDIEVDSALLIVSQNLVHLLCHLSVRWIS